MLFVVERFGNKVFIDALLNCGKYVVSCWENGAKITIHKYSWLRNEIEGYIKMYSNRSIEFT